MQLNGTQIGNSMIKIRKEEIVLWLFLTAVIGMVAGSLLTHWDIADTANTIGVYEPSILGKFVYTHYEIDELIGVTYEDWR